jgi:tRNA U34 5-carboxymethylaminomethyl modifying enzyme MnmG/GidA
VIRKLTKKIEVKLNVDEHLWLLAKDKLDMNGSEFLEYALRLYLREDTQVARLFKKGIKLQMELNKVTARMYKLQNKNKSNINIKEFESAMETVYRIQDVLGYVGRNQLMKIANQREFNNDEWINYVQSKEGIIVKNYGELPKVR